MHNNAELQATIDAMIAAGRGILAADESSPTIEKRLASIQVESTQEHRRKYRQLLFSTPGLGRFISGVILFEETLKQLDDQGVPLPRVLSEQGIIAGIKVDKGIHVLAGSNDEKVTAGLDGLAERLAEYHACGARFAKWRAVFSISERQPSSRAVSANAEMLARYASICQSQNMVPIVEPEVLMDGKHDIERCAAVTERVQHAVFDALYRHGVQLEHMLLKPNMVVAGSDQTSAPPSVVAAYTLEVLKRTVPVAVPGIAFLSGGQSAAEASANLAAINEAIELTPWVLTFSYGRALQQPVLKVWQGQSENIERAQNELLERARINGNAVRSPGWPSTDAAARDVLGSQS